MGYPLHKFYSSTPSQVQPEQLIIFYIQMYLQEHASLFSSQPYKEFLLTIKHFKRFLTNFDSQDKNWTFYIFAFFLASSNLIPIHFYVKT